VGTNQTIGEALDEIDAVWEGTESMKEWYAEQNADWQHKGESHG
jgi:hypothetical protein